MKIGRNNYFYIRKNMQKGFKKKKKETNRMKKYETFDHDIGEIPSLAYHRSTENNRIKEVVST